MLPRLFVLIAITLSASTSANAGSSDRVYSGLELYQWQWDAYRRGWSECWSIYRMPPSLYNAFDFQVDLDDPQRPTPFLQAPWSVGVAKCRGFAHCRLILMPLSRTLGKGQTRTIVAIIDKVTNPHAYNLRRSSTQSSLNR